MKVNNTKSQTGNTNFSEFVAPVSLHLHQFSFLIVFAGLLASTYVEGKYAAVNYTITSKYNVLFPSCLESIVCKLI